MTVHGLGDQPRPQEREHFDDRSVHHLGPVGHGVLLGPEHVGHVGVELRRALHEPGQVGILERAHGLLGQTLRRGEPVQPRVESGGIFFRLDSGDDRIRDLLEPEPQEFEQCFPHRPEFAAVFRSRRPGLFFPVFIPLRVIVIPGLPASTRTGYTSARRRPVTGVTGAGDAGHRAPAATRPRERCL